MPVMMLLLAGDTMPCDAGNDAGNQPGQSCSFVQCSYEYGKRMI
jgi:hypothetical protein